MAILALLTLLATLTPDDLVTFCVLGKVEEFRRAVNDGASVSATNKQGETPLVAAASYRQKELVAFLLERGADPNQTGRSGRSALEEAAWDGELEIMMLLLRAGADPNLGSSSSPPLYTAVLSGKAEAVKLLLEHGADVTPDISSSPLHCAAQSGSSEMVRHLLAAGAEPNKRSPDGSCPIHEAAQRGHTACVVALLKGGADGRLSLPNGATPFEIAAAYGHAEAAGQLLPYVQNLQNALETACSGGLVELSKVLIERGAQPTEYAYKAAAEYRDNQLLKVLSEGSQIRPYLSALPHASRAGNTEGVRFLLSFGLPVDTTDDQGATPLILAAAYGHADSVELLLSFGADPKAQDKNGQDAEARMNSYQQLLENRLQGFSRYRCLHPGEGELRETLEAYKRNRPKILKLLGGRED